MTRPEISDERVRNLRAWAAARVGDLSGADVTVAVCDEVLEYRALSRQGETDCAQKASTGEALLDEVNDTQALPADLASAREAVWGVQALIKQLQFNLRTTESDSPHTVVPKEIVSALIALLQREHSTPSAVSADAQAVEQFDPEEIHELIQLVLTLKEGLPNMEKFYDIGPIAPIYTRVVDVLRTIQRSPAPDAAQIVEGRELSKAPPPMPYVTEAFRIALEGADVAMPVLITMLKTADLKGGLMVADEIMGNVKAALNVLRANREHIDRAIAYLASRSKPELREAMRIVLAAAKFSKFCGWHNQIDAKAFADAAQLLEDAAGAR